MYDKFFGLNEAPFTLTPNTHFFLKSETHQQGLELLLFAIRNREGFIKVTGEVGTGKTLLCRKLLNALDDDYATAYIPNPCFSAETLYSVVADELSQVEKTLPHDVDDVILVDQGNSGVFSENMADKYILAQKQITNSLLKCAAAHKPVVLIIDEAQSMPVSTLEALRLLSNLETESQKLIHIVLFGQPELDSLLEKNSLRQLLQRITFQHYIKPLGRPDIENYVSHRMLLAGYTGGRLFDKSAMGLLVSASRGIPRLVNILCHKALLSAYGKGERVITKHHMKKAIKDTDSVRMPAKAWMPFAALALAFLGEATSVLGQGWIL